MNLDLLLHFFYVDPEHFLHKIDIYNDETITKKVQYIEFF